MGWTQIVKGDRAMVIRGNARDPEGTVRGVVRKTRQVVVQGVNMRKRDTGPSQENPEGGIITFEGPIHISNVMLIEPATGEASRVRVRVEPDGLKERIAVRSGNPVPKGA